MKRDLGLLLAALLAVFACAPLAYPGFFFGQSGLAAAYNLADFQQHPSLSWRPGLALGAPFGGFTLLPYYLGVLLAGIGFTSVGAVKLLYAAGFALSATGAYALARMFFPAAASRGYAQYSSVKDGHLKRSSVEPAKASSPGERAMPQPGLEALAGQPRSADDIRGFSKPYWSYAAVLAAVIYTYLPYHLASTYVRANLGESLAFGLAPWVGFCLWRLLRSVVKNENSADPHPGPLPARERERERTWPLSMQGRGGRLLPSPSEGEGQGEGEASAKWTTIGAFKAGGGTGSQRVLLPLAFWLVLSSLLVAGLLLTQPGLGLLSLLVLVGGAAAFAIRLPEYGLLLRGAGALAAPLAIGLAVAWPLASPLASSAEGLSEAGTQMVDLSRLFSPVWADGLPAQLGLIASALAILSFVPAATDASGLSGTSGRLVRYLQVASLIPILLMLPPLGSVWPILRPLAGEPYHLLFVAALPLSLLAGSLLLRKGLSQPLAAASLIMLAVLASYGYLSPKFGAVDEPSHIVAGRIGEDIVLLDYRLSQGESDGSVLEVEKGGEVRLRLVWQALRPPKEDVTVFTHLLDGGQALRGQHDGQPVGGTRPTSKWREGDVIVDDHVIRVDPSAPSGEYAIAVGMYLPQTGQRLLVVARGQADTKVILIGLRVGR